MRIRKKFICETGPNHLIRLAHFQHFQHFQYFQHVRFSANWKIEMKIEKKQTIMEQFTRVFRRANSSQSAYTQLAPHGRLFAFVREKTMKRNCQEMISFAFFHKKWALY